MSKPTLEEIRRDFDMGNKALWEKAPEYTETLLELLAAETKRREEAERKLILSGAKVLTERNRAEQAEARAERAEADNAALLADLRSMHEVAQGVMRHEERERTRYAILDRMDAAHPGAGLLERMRALEEFALAAAAYFEQHSAEHEHDPCPEDDTCECPILVRLNAASVVLTNLKVPRE